MDFWETYGLAVISVVGILIVAGLIRNRFKRPTKAQLVISEEVARAEYDALPKCVCGDLAKYPAPVLRRDRGAWDWLRSHFAAAPRYKRAVDLMRQPVFCEPHAHLADALLDQFIFGIRKAYSELNAKVAAEAAGFESESLTRLVAENLTEQQKRYARKTTAPLRLLPQKSDEVIDANGTSGPST